MIVHPSQWRDRPSAKAAVDKDSVPPGIREAANAAWKSKAPWPLVFLGEAGAGKTCGAMMMLKALAHGGWFMELERLCNYVARAQYGTLQDLPGESGTGYPLSELTVWSRYSKTALAIVDDIGKREKVSDHHRSVLMQCLEVRLDKWTVYTSNLTLDELAEVYKDDRIMSRLQAGTVVYVQGDKRQKQGQSVGHPILKDGWDK